MRMCLCGMLGAEIVSLPSEVSPHIKAFFQRNITWLTSAYTLKGFGQDATNKAVQTLALLEGAMMMSNVLGDIQAFDNASRILTD